MGLTEAGFLTSHVVGANEENQIVTAHPFGGFLSDVACAGPAGRLGCNCVIHIRPGKDIILMLVFRCKLKSFLANSCNYGRVALQVVFATNEFSSSGVATGFTILRRWFTKAAGNV